MPLASHRTEHSYISVAAFNGNIFQYTTQLNSTTLKREGKLTSISATPTGVALSAVNCPPGRILRETGNKLYPGTHPGLAVGDTFSGATVGTTATNKYWVLVYDAQTGVRGFIDPNGPLFTTYSTDKPIEISDALESAGGAATRLGGPIFTAGNITTTGGSVIQQKPVLAASIAPLTLTAAQTVGGVVTQAPLGAQAVNLPATADIISAMGSYVGTTTEFIYINTSANVATVTAGDGSTTLVGVMTVAATTSARFIIRIATSTTVVLYRA
jgi:hypothetical protein